MADQEYTDDEIGSDDDYSDVVDESGEFEPEKLVDATPQDRAFSITDENGEKVEISEAFAKKLVKQYQDDNKWQKSNTKKSQEIADQRKQLDADRAAYEQQRKIADQKRDVDYQARGARSDELENLELQRSITYLTRQYPDFNYEELKKFVNEFNDEEVHDRLHILHLAWRGSQLDQARNDAKAEVVREAKGKRGLPAGGKVTGSEGEEEEDPYNLKSLKRSAGRAYKRTPAGSAGR